MTIREVSKQTIRSSLSTSLRLHLSKNGTKFPRTRPSRAVHVVELSLERPFFNMADSSCYTVVFEPSGGEFPPVSELRSALEKGSDEVKLDTLRKIIVGTINGNAQV